MMLIKKGKKKLNAYLSLIVNFAIKSNPLWIG
jgi:hypothetical protein